MAGKEELNFGIAVIEFCYVQNENGDQSFRTGPKPQIELKKYEKIFIEIGGG